MSTLPLGHLPNPNYDPNEDGSLPSYPPFVFAENALDRAATRDYARLFVYLYGDSSDVEQRLRDPRYTRSELDLDFAALLARYCSRDSTVIEAVMRDASPLRRPKWDERRGAGTLLGFTVKNALRKTRDDPDPATLSVRPEATAVRPIVGITVAELAKNPAMLEVPPPVGAWLTYRGELTLLVGREKLGGKSTLAASDARAVVRAGGTVLWLTAEESLNRVVKRFIDLDLTADELSRIVVNERWPQSWEEVEALVAVVGPDAVYVDSLSSFLMAVDGKVPETSQGEAWQAKTLRFKSWAQAHDCAVVVLVHATKADGSYRGSTGIGAAPDTIFTMRDDPDDKVCRWLDAVGRWGIPRGGSEAAAFAALKPGMTTTEWASASGLPLTTFFRVRKKLVRDREVAQNADGTWHPIIM